MPATTLWATNAARTGQSQTLVAGGYLSNDTSFRKFNSAKTMWRLFLELLQNGTQGGVMQ